jgi:hypothetical protein
LDPRLVKQSSDTSMSIQITNHEAIHARDGCGKNNGIKHLGVRCLTDFVVKTQSSCAYKLLAIKNPPMGSVVIVVIRDNLQLWAIKQNTF